MTPFTDTPSWHALLAHRDAHAAETLESLWKGDPRRGEALTFQCAGIAVDFSKQRITPETVKLLVDLARERDVPAGISTLFAGEKVNVTEGRPALHMPGSWSRVSPFLQKLPGLQSGQKAAAVNLGIFPGESGTTQYSSNAISSPYAASASTANVVNRLAGIEDQLNQPEPPASAPQPTWQQAPTQVAYVAPAPRQTVPRATPVQQRVWLQLASGPNAEALPDQFRRMKSRDRNLFDGIGGYVAKSPDKARLLIGPFRGKSDAEIFAQDLSTIGVDAFSWTNSTTDQIVPLGTE